MAETFAKWLQKAADDHGIGAADKPVLVVGVNGKSTKQVPGCQFLDQVLDQTVFCGRYETEEFVNISAYYSEYHQILFLYLHSYQDGDVQEKIFDSGKPFFEALESAESAFIRHLFVLFVVSHIVIFVQPDIRIDTTLIRHLMAVNEMRTQRRQPLMRKLDKLPTFSAAWRAEGRLALPRLLFLFHDNSRRHRGSPEDALNYADRVERSREYQLVRMLKKTQICAEHLGIALASLTPHRVPFVHLIRSSEQESVVVTDTLSRVFMGELLYTDLKPFLDDRLNTNIPAEQAMDIVKFLLGHVKDVVENESKLPYYFAIPKLRTFVNGARVVMDAVSKNEIYDQSLISRWLSEELHFIDDYASQIAYYSYELYNRLIWDDKVGSMFYDPKLTEARHYRTIQHVASFIKTSLLGKQAEEVWSIVLKQCNARFKFRQNRCYVRSASSAQCSLLVHREPAEFIQGQSMDEALRGRTFNHCSGYSYLSTCSCGKTQKKRADPFSAKEANYDFYTTFPCCTKTEMMPFRLYNPGIKWDVSRSTSIVIRKPEQNRRERLRILSNKSKDVDNEKDRFSTYTVVKPKSQTRIVNELLWQFNKMQSEHQGRYLPHMHHSSITNSELTPLFPSWSVACIGLAKQYVHVKGLTDMPNFVKGSEFLLPWDLALPVKSEQWTKGMKDILGVDRLPFKERRLDRNVQEQTHKEKIKFFIGFEYECPKGHRFMCEKPQKMLIHDRSKGTVKTDASEMISSNLPLFMLCKCSIVQRSVNAQLMRLHIVTPKAPICVKLNPLVMMDATGGFHMGQTAELNWGRYYVLRFPFIYEGPTGMIRKPTTSTTTGTLLANCIQIYQKI
ncbi:hypothetical protein M3Y95_00135600 [Aphelenchoides besseyi]|nr:hypothetical protein M3Y95_00135600 [Aphelenchoides besseyi]